MAASVLCGDPVGWVLVALRIGGSAGCTRGMKINKITGSCRAKGNGLQKQAAIPSWGGAYAHGPRSESPALAGDLHAYGTPTALSWGRVVLSFGIEQDHAGAKPIPTEIVMRGIFPNVPARGVTLSDSKTLSDSTPSPPQNSPSRISYSRWGCPQEV